jgi:hypothetical protein
MKTNQGWIGCTVIILLAWGWSPPSTAEPLGTAISYQGKLEVADMPADGTYDFEFKVYNALSDGTQVAGPVVIGDATVIDGLFTLQLDFGPAVFTGDACWLEIGVRPAESEDEYEVLSPRQPITAAPYALYALSGPESPEYWSLSGNDLSNTNTGNVGIGTTAPSHTLTVDGNGFFSGEIETTAYMNVIAGEGGDARLRTSLYDGFFLGTPFGGQLATYDENGNITGLFGSSLVSGGYINLLTDGGGAGLMAEGDSEGAGRLALKNIDRNDTVVLDGDEGDGGGDISIMDGENTTIELDGKRVDGGAAVLLRNSAATLTVSVDADSGGAGHMDLRNVAGTQTVLMDGDDDFDGGGRLRLRDGTMTRFELDADSLGGGAWMGMANSGGLNTVTITADYAYDAPQIMLRQASGVPGVVLYGNYEGSGSGRIVAGVMEITGGSDLSEQFDVSSPDGNAQAGMVVCIDPEKPGALAVSREPYDRKVAGILSGAGGVEPGMMMAQDGSVADGGHPVALTGRVYCLADASQVPIEPGDLLTTSHRPGHAMKVRDYARAHGAVIGKAMTSLQGGQGLVLVLVNLQ